MDPNPYAAPTADDDRPPTNPFRNLIHTVSRFLTFGGFFAASYATIALNFLPWLPPQDGTPGGRELCRWLLIGGCIAAAIGRNLSEAATPGAAGKVPGRGEIHVPTSIGLLIIFGFLIGMLLLMSLG